MDVAILLLLTIFSVEGQMFSNNDRCQSPDTLDLSRNPVTASSTCGDDNFSQYCYVNLTDSKIQCRTCEQEEEVQASNVVDNQASTHWISRPGLEAVNLTVDLIQPFRVTFIQLQTSSSLSRKLPTQWEIHKSIDNGTSFIPWIYLFDSASLCPDGGDNVGVPNENQIACFDTASVMSREGLAIVTLVNNLQDTDLSPCGTYKTELLRNYSYATHIRLVFLTNNESSGNASQLFYSITAFDVEGFCVCNGYADQCIVDDDSGLYHCDCLNGTCGRYCDHCCPLYNNAPYIAHGRGCVECNCSGHADSCVYNETLEMGVCVSCKNNTTGINCEQCLPQHYQHLASCLPCECNEDGITDDGQCDDVGQCNCKEGYVFGLKCDPCPSGTFHNGGSCYDCQCPTNSSGVQLSCDAFSGQCACPPNTTGLRCDMCVDNTWDLDVDHGCKPCSCDVMGANGIKCDNSTGQCSCREGYAGLDCSQCRDLYYWDGSKCVPCNCHTEGSWRLNCNSTTGQCACKEHVEGRTCSLCEEGYYNLTTDNNGCLSCSCDVIGSTSSVCDDVTGQCDCKVERSGRTCKDCKDGYYINTQATSCLACECSEHGSISSSCREDGHCSCKNGVVGEKCDTCAIGYWGLSAGGCNECDCSNDGTDRARICDPINGQCVCAEGISGPRCTQCEGLSHFIIDNGTCTACDNCSQNLIDQLSLLVDNMNSTINLLSDNDVVHNSNQFDQLRNAASAVMREVMEWSISVNESLCRVGINVYCQPVMGMYSILTNYTTLSTLVEELQSFFPQLVEDVNSIVKLTNQTYYTITLFETNVTVAHNDTKVVLNKTIEVLSEITEQLLNVEQLLNDSETALATIIERDAHFRNISDIVELALDDARIRYDYSEPFLHNRTQENITVNDINNELKMLQLILQELYALSSNVSLTVNNTLIYNRNLNDNITRLKAILNTTATLNTTIGDLLNDTWVLYVIVYEMWEETELLLQNVTDIINVLNSTALPCAENETESFKNWLDNLTDLAVKTDNHSIRLRTDSSLIINESSFWLQRGDNFLRNVSNLLSTLNFTEMRSDINRILDAAHNAIAKINEANLTSLNKSVSQLSNESNLLSVQLRNLSNEIQIRKNEAGVVKSDSGNFMSNVEKRQMVDATFQNDITHLTKRVDEVSRDIISIGSNLSEAEDLINRSMMVAEQVINKSSEVEADIIDIRENIILTNSSLMEVDEIDDNITIHSTNISSSIKYLTADIDHLIDKNKNMISEIDAIIQGLYDIHQEINQMNGPLRLTAKDDKKPFISLQPPPGRPLTSTAQYETIDLFLYSDDIENNTLLFYAGPAKAKDEENDEILQQGDYMALLSQTTRNGENELLLVYKLSGDADVHQLSLTGSDFIPIVATRVHISRVGSTFTLAMKNFGTPAKQEDSVSFTNGSLLFTGNNQTVFYIGGKPSDVELPSVVNSTSHYSGIVSLLLYNGQIWGLWNVRDAFSAGFTDDLVRFESDIIDIFDRQLTLSFSGDSYLHTEGLFSRPGNILVILIKPFSTEGLVMFVYDEKTSVSLEIHYNMGYLVVIFNGNESRNIASPPGKRIRVTIWITNRPSVIVQFDLTTHQVRLDRPIMRDFTKAKSWFGGINDDAKYLGINQTKPFFGCIELFLDGRSITTDEDHFMRHYINSATHKRLSLECLNTQYVHSASFNGSGRIQFDGTIISDDTSIIESNKTFNSFSFEFVVDLEQSNSTGLLYASTKSGSLSIILYNHSIRVTLCDQNGSKKHLNSSIQLKPGRIHFLLLYLNYTDRYQLYVDDILEDTADSFENQWTLDLFTSTESPKLVLGAVDDQEQLPYFKGCMRNLAIQFRTVSFLSSQSSGSDLEGVTYRTCNVLVSPQEQPLLAVAPAEPSLDRCTPATMNFTTLSGIYSCSVPELTDGDNFTIEAIPQRPNGLLLALVNNTDLVYAIGTREGKGMYYANNRTEEFGDVCPSLITLDIASHDHVIMINGSVSVNITLHNPVSLYIGGLPEGTVSDNTINFLQCDDCKCPPGFLGELEIQEIDLNYLVESTEHRNCKMNTQ